MNNTIRRLREARDYIADPNHFTTGVRWSSDGNRNCAIGAIERAYGITGELDWKVYKACNFGPEMTFLSLAAKELLAELASETMRWAEKLGDGRPGCEFSDQYYIALLNNEVGHEAVVRMFDRAIEVADMAERLDLELEAEPQFATTWAKVEISPSVLWRIPRNSSASDR